MTIPTKIGRRQVTAVLAAGALGVTLAACNPDNFLPGFLRLKSSCTASPGFHKRVDEFLFHKHADTLETPLTPLSRPRKKRGWLAFLQVEKELPSHRG